MANENQARLELSGHQAGLVPGARDSSPRWMWFTSQQKNDSLIYQQVRARIDLDRANKGNHEAP
jgi:hypothetical protein